MHYLILGSPLSPFVRKVRVFCAEKDITYNLEPINPFNPPDDWHAISPLGRIPVLALVDDDGSRRYLPDSSMIFPRMQGKEPDETKARDTLENRMPPFFNYLDEQIGEREFFVEDRFTIADIAVATSFVNMAHAGFAPDPEKWPRLARFLERIHRRESFADCIAEERKILGL